MTAPAVRSARAATYGTPKLVGSLRVDLVKLSEGYAGFIEKNIFQGSISM